MENLIECDNVNCDFVIKNDNPTEYDINDNKKYINQKCPKCGEVLLTEQDDKIFNKVMKKVNFINKYFSWICYLNPFYNKTTSKIDKANIIDFKVKDNTSIITCINKIPIKIKSPLRDCDMILKKRKQEFHYNGIDLMDVDYYFYQCEITNEEFTNSDLDEINYDNIILKYKNINEK